VLDQGARRESRFKPKVELHPPCEVDVLAALQGLIQAAQAIEHDPALAAVADQQKGSRASTKPRLLVEVITGPLRIAL
jgi:hypothetical protein